MTTVLHWNGVLLELSRRDYSQGYASGEHNGPTRTSRAMAIAHLALYNAVVAVERPGTHYKGLSGKLAAGPFPKDHLGEIIDGAACAVLSKLYPRQTQLIQDSIACNRSTMSFEHGLGIGETVFADRDPLKDGSDAPDTRPTRGSVPYGKHRADPYDAPQMLLGPKWGSVKRFTGLHNQKLAAFPGAEDSDYLSDAHYLRDYVEVMKLGGRAPGSRTPEQSLIGVYWAYDGAQGLGVPPRLYNQITRSIISRRGLTDVVETAELFAKVNVAMADAGIDAWHHKFVHNLWRPVVGIRNEPKPHGEATPDSFWAPFGAPQTNKPGTGPRTPPFPAYPSGHATFGAALFQVLRLHFRGEPITTKEVLDAQATDNRDPEFSFVSDELDGISQDTDGSVRTRHKKSFSNYPYAIQENAISRVYLGVHWRFDGLPKQDATTKEELDVGGVPLGLKVGIEAHNFFHGLISSGNAAP